MYRRVDTQQNPEFEQSIYTPPPQPWIELILAHWEKATEAECLWRKGPNGSLQPLEGARVLFDGDDARDAAEAISSHLYGLGVAKQEEVGGTVDLCLKLWERGADGGYRPVASTMKGGRVRPGGEREDAPEEGDMPAAEFRSTLKTCLGAIGTLVGYIEKSTAANLSLIGGIQPFVAQAATVRAEEVKAEAAAYRADRASETFDRTISRLEPHVGAYVEARRQEAVGKRARPPTGDPVLDAWRDLIDSVDMPTGSRIKAMLPDIVADKLVRALSQGDLMDTPQIRDLWAELKSNPEFAEIWPELLASLSSRAAECLARLADAIRSN